MTTQRNQNPEGFVLRNAACSALVTLAANAGFAIACVLLGTLILGAYGYLLFLGLPFVLGLTTVLIHGIGGRRGFLQFFGVAMLTLLVLFASLLLFAVEGAGCLIMAAPLWAACTVAGVAAGYPIHRALWRPGPPVRGFPVAALALMALVPALMGAESRFREEPPLIAVTTTVDIDAPAEVVWRNVLAFPPLPRPHGWAFSLGAAYPRHAVILGHGVGAIRHCVFSTGAFVEPITAWQENRRLAFDVAESPPSMQEWSPYENLHPPHLEGYLASRRGEFLLTPLAGNRTRLQGTTWYQIHMSPNGYWSLWSSAIIHRIHLSVLGHIKAISEGDLKASGRIDE